MPGLPGCRWSNVFGDSISRPGGGQGRVTVGEDARRPRRENRAPASAAA